MITKYRHNWGVSNQMAFPISLVWMRNKIALYLFGFHTSCFMLLILCLAHVVEISRFYFRMSWSAISLGGLVLWYKASQAEGMGSNLGSSLSFSNSWWNYNCDLHWALRRRKTAQNFAEATWARLPRHHYQIFVFSPYLHKYAMFQVSIFQVSGSNLTCNWHAHKYTGLKRCKLNLWKLIYSRDPTYENLSILHTRIQFTHSRHASTLRIRTKNGNFIARWLINYGGFKVHAISRL